jgi:hypothetical protein
MFHIELFENERAILHHLAIDTAYQNQGHEVMLRKLAEKSPQYPPARVFYERNRLVF